MKRYFALITTAGILTLPATAQSPLQSAYESAYYAWDAGRYAEALEGFSRLLRSAGGHAYLEPIALLTGELYRTSEVSADGTDPRWSPDGRLLSYEVASGAPVQTYIVSPQTGGPRTVAVLDGTDAVLSVDGYVAYLVLDRGPDYARARAQARQGVQLQSRADFFRLRAILARINAEYTTVRVRELASGEERKIDTRGLAPYELHWGADSEELFFLAGRRGDSTRTDLYVVGSSGTPRPITTTDGRKTNVTVVPEAGMALYETDGSVGVLNLGTGDTRAYRGAGATASRDGSTIVFVRHDADVNIVTVARAGSEPQTVYQTPNRVDNVAVSPDGSGVIFQIMERENWELMVVNTADRVARRLTHEVQHDLLPRFISEDRVLAVVGESRHRRSYLYDVTTGERTRLFHNNTIRTVAPEYEWAVSPDGSRVAIVSERDGDTISPERGVYVVDVEQQITTEDLQARLDVNYAAESRLRREGERWFAPLAEEVTAVVADVSAARIYDYERSLFAFGSKHITQPGNALAIEYLTERLRSFGYEPELQWFEPRPGIRSANVIATLPGSVDPDIVYVVSSHFDSVERGPGADDNTSGTTALLEAARVLTGRPQPATIQFAFFTGEEAGLLGSREFVRRAVEAGVKIVGALNNDMVGFANDNRLDNTIRYSNAGIRDIQHAAAFLFTDLITYDAKYYKSTDAHAYYEAYGDIVGGIGSYPILGNPHYHQTHDVLETINHQLVAEVSKTTVATLQLLASSPSRLTGLQAPRDSNAVHVEWAPAVESDVESYVVAYGPDESRLQLVEVAAPSAILHEVAAGWVILVKARSALGTDGWDWARIVVQ